ncbi:MAG: DUF5071 domain-containing protein [Bacillota bacterium]
MLVLPINKKYWDNAAIVLKEIGYPRILNAFPDILEWIADPNWPGYDIIYELVCSIDKDVLTPHIEQEILKAKDANDDILEERLKNILKR